MARNGARLGKSTGSHTVEKIGGTSMSDYQSVRDNIITRHSPRSGPYNRVFIVSAYAGVTDRLLEHKKTGQPGVYALFRNGIDDTGWRNALDDLGTSLCEINRSLFGSGELRQEADAFIGERLREAGNCLEDLFKLCRHGHFALDNQLATVREMLASLGEAHSAWNTATLLQRDGINTQFVDLTGWKTLRHTTLDERIRLAFADIDISRVLPVVTGYAHSSDGLMSSFDRGYSEMTFCRAAVNTGASEAIIHKEFHLCSADPKLVGSDKAVPIGRTNYDVAEQLANLGMEAIHPKAAQGLRMHNIPLRVKNTFEPEHSGTLITRGYVSDTPCVEIIAGRTGIMSLELFDQEMTGSFAEYDTRFLGTAKRFGAHVVSKDVNANTITHYLATNLKTIKRMRETLQEEFPNAEISHKSVAIVSAIGSDMKIPGILAQAVQAVANRGVSVLALHQCMRQVDMQFVVDESDYETTIKALHHALVEVHEHGRAIRLASA